MVTIKIKVSLSVLFVVIFLFFADDSSYALSYFISIIIHEFGHISLAYVFGIRIRELKIDLLGARIALCNQGLSYGKEALISIAGPLSNVLTGLI